VIGWGESFLLSASCCCCLAVHRSSTLTRCRLTAPVVLSGSLFLAIFSVTRSMRETATRRMLAHVGRALVWGSLAWTCYQGLHSCAISHQPL
jgi:hypothetical protein